MHVFSVAIKNYMNNYSGLPTACWQGIFLTFVNAISIGICFFLSLYYVNDLHFSVAMSSLLISCYGSGTIIGGILGGKLSDRLSSRFVSIISLSIQAICFFLLIKLRLPQLLMGNMFLLGIAAYGFKTSNNIWTLDQCKSEKKLRLKAISILYAAANLGLGISGILIGMLESYGFENIFELFGALLIFSAIYLSFHKQSTIYSFQAEINNNLQTIQNQDINKKVIILILICLFCIGLIIAQLSATYPIYIEEAFPQLGVRAVSILFILDTSLIVLFQTPLISLVSKSNKIFIVGLGAFLMGLGMLVLNYSTYYFILALLSCVIWATGEMLFVPMAQLVCYEKGGEKKKGQALGIFQATFALSSVTGPIIGGLIYGNHPI